MTEVIRHRGPDDEGEALVIRRGTACYSGTDTMPERELTVSCNGELYNYLELWGELGALGHTFHITSDTEILLHAYC